MDEIKAIADMVEVAGNTIDSVIDWLKEDGVGDNAIDELTDVMENCLGSAARLREIARKGCQMPGRRWHVEHPDGREWTSRELDRLAVRLKEDSHIAPYDALCRCMCVDEEGEPVLLDEYGKWLFVDGDRYGMRVVWDG